MEQTQQQLEKEYAERDRLETKFQAEYPDGFDRISDEVEAMKRIGLYCSTCQHGNGCEHGVPASRY
jgi:hypothetical protein